MGRASKRKQDKRKRLATLLDVYDDAATEVLPRYFRPDCCLNGTRVAVEALAEFGISVEPLATTVEVYNPKMVQRVEEHGGWDDIPRDEMDAWRAEGCWVGACDGTQDERPGWPWHMIGLAGKWIVDSSLGQFSRPQKGVDLWPLLVHPARGLSRGGSLALQDDRGAVLVYRVAPEASWADTTGFLRSPHNLHVAAAVIRAMRDRLEHSQ